MLGVWPHSTESTGAVRLEPAYVRAPRSRSRKSIYTVSHSGWLQSDDIRSSDIQTPVRMKE